MLTTLVELNSSVEKHLTISREFLLDQPMQMLSYRWMIETLDDFVQKAGD